MEPIEWAVAALIFIAAKAPDKAADKILDKLWEQGENLLSQLRRKAPQTALAIEQAKTVPLDWEQTVIDIQAMAQTDAEVAQAVQAVEVAAQERVETIKMLEEIARAVKTQRHPQSYINTIEKVVNLAQGERATIKIEQQNINL